MINRGYVAGKWATVSAIAQAFGAFYGSKFSQYNPEHAELGEAMRLLATQEAQGIKGSPAGKVRVPNANTLIPEDSPAAMVQLEEGEWETWMINRGYVAGR